MENHHFQWRNQLQMAIFHSYVTLPEGTNCWLMVEPPLWKIWVCQLGWLFPTEWKNKKGSKPPTRLVLGCTEWTATPSIGVNISRYNFVLCEGPSLCLISKFIKFRASTYRQRVFDIESLSIRTIVSDLKLWLQAWETLSHGKCEQEFGGTTGCRSLAGTESNS